jgi:hypothetical protein
MGSTEVRNIEQTELLTMAILAEKKVIRKLLKKETIFYKRLHVRRYTSGIR